MKTIPELIRRFKRLYPEYEEGYYWVEIKEPILHLTYYLWCWIEKGGLPMNTSKLRYIRLHVDRKQYKKARYLRKMNRAWRRLDARGNDGWI